MLDIAVPKLISCVETGLSTWQKNRSSRAEILSQIYDTHYTTVNKIKKICNFYLKWEKNLKNKDNTPNDGEIPRCTHKPMFAHTIHRMWLCYVWSSLHKNVGVCEWCVHIVRLKKWMPCVLNPFHYWSQRRKVKNAKFTSSIKNHSFLFYPHIFWHQRRDGCGGRHKNAAVRKLEAIEWKFLTANSECRR
jgi:hypothetical protein